MQPTDIRKLMAGMRFEPKTAEQWEQATAGAAAMDHAWEAKEVQAFIGGAMRYVNRYYRAAYELRYHELLAAVAAS